MEQTGATEEPKDNIQTKAPNENNTKECISAEEDSWKMVNFKKQRRQGSV